MTVQPTDAKQTRQGARRMGEQLLSLPHGGTLAFEEYGSPAGVPVIFCHGWPSSRTMAELTDGPARELGVRIISPDRPGISASTLQAERKLSDWPAMLAILADHLQLDTFRILAVSGGAPYAFAAARAMPGRVRAIAIVSGAPPLFDMVNPRNLLPLYRWMLALYRRNPELLRTLFRLVRPFASFRMTVKLTQQFMRFLQPCDAEALRDITAFNACFESQRRAWRGSAEGVLLDARIYAEPWGFDLKEVDVPVRLWHGKLDRSFSLKLAEDVAGRLPNCTPHFVDNAGHYSLPIRQMREILADLIQDL
jgi:pimeloyl-ACP methyl ester carboxylesterase